jgi:hypothetical protein
MVNKTWVAISCGCAFLSVYFMYIVYAIFSTKVNTHYDKAVMPQSIAMNSTTSAISSMSSWSGLLVTIAIVALILVIFFIISATRSMGIAYG